MMARTDYAHWNEEADYMWWQEEGRHVEEPEYDPDDYLDHVGPSDVFAEEIGEMESDELRSMLADADYCKRWPHAVAMVKRELKFRGEEEDVQQQAEIVPGTVLKNGATVMLAKKVGEYVIVMARWGDEYITWKVNPDDGEAYWGDYFRDVLDATADWLERSHYRAR